MRSGLVAAQKRSDQVAGETQQCLLPRLYVRTRQGNHGVGLKSPGEYPILSTPGRGRVGLSVGINTNIVSQ
jgi:hypothetical protein